jgi:hypothetical protein
VTTLREWPKEWDAALLEFVGTPGGTKLRGGSAKVAETLSAMFGREISRSAVLGRIYRIAHPVVPKPRKPRERRVIQLKPDETFIEPRKPRVIRQIIDRRILSDAVKAFAREEITREELMELIAA